MLERARRAGWALWAVAGVSLLSAETIRMECCGADVFHRTHRLQLGAATSVLRLKGGTECYYELLGLQKGETPTENCIRRAYHKMALRCHPDRAPPEKKEQAERAFKALKEAYDSVLMNPSQRRAYDGAGFNAQFMPSACAQDMPSVFDSLSEWEKYFGLPFSCDESSDEDKKEGVCELKALKEALNHAYDMPCACPDAIPSIFDSISVWEKFLGLPVSHATASLDDSARHDVTGITRCRRRHSASSSAGSTDASTNAAGVHGAHEQRPVKPDADSSVGFKGIIEVINAESAIERNVYGDLLASMNDKEAVSKVEAGAVISGVISEWEKYLGVSPSCTAMQVL